MTERVRSATSALDYVEIADADSIQPIEHGDVGDRALIAVAARFDGARLIDNVILGEDPPPIDSDIQPASPAGA